jgi:acetoin utilization protein AcuB
MTNRTIQAWMTSPVVTISPDASLKDARILVAESKIRVLPVVSKGELVGIITRRGLLRRDMSHLHVRAAHSAIPLKKLLIRDVMTANPLTIAPTALVAKAARILLENKITALPVVENRELVGILTNSDLMRFIVNEYPSLKIPITT